MKNMIDNGGKQHVDGPKPEELESSIKALVDHNNLKFLMPGGKEIPLADVKLTDIIANFFSEKPELYNNIFGKDLTTSELSRRLDFISGRLFGDVNASLKRAVEKYHVNEATIDIKEIQSRIHDKVESVFEILGLELNASTDPLTGLLNRRPFAKMLSAEVAGEIRNPKKGLSVLFMDIDHFKNVNDTYGHDVGDKVLKRVTDIIKSIHRGYDFLARFGGEEFVLLCPDMSPIDALRLARRISNAVKEDKNPVLDKDGNPINVSISIGISDFKEAKEGLTEEEARLVGEGKSNDKLLEKIGDFVLKSADTNAYVVKGVEADEKGRIEDRRGSISMRKRVFRSKRSSAPEK